MKDVGNRFILRDATREDHEALDAIVGPFSNRASYLRYLEGMAHFRARLEPVLGDMRYDDSFEGWRPGLILADLHRDLADLGGSVPVPGHQIGPAGNRAGLFGMLYVLEGSAIGARLLMKRAAELGYTAAFGARHLAAQTARPDSWMRFVRLLDALSPQGMEQAIRSARMTFATAIEAFGGTASVERAR
jgi:heme oxygenase (biliverdin-IX-beta and delta-forming)